jgi:hypothetical protein
VVLLLVFALVFDVLIKNYAYYPGLDVVRR